MPRILLQIASVFSPNRVFVYSIVSFFAILAVIANALNKHSTFYAAAVHLSRSNGNVLVSLSSAYLISHPLICVIKVLANFAFLLSLTLNRLIQAVFFGELRMAEVEVCKFLYSLHNTYTPPAPL